MSYVDLMRVAIILILFLFLFMPIFIWEGREIKGFYYILAFLVVVVTFSRLGGLI